MRIEEVRRYTISFLFPFPAMDHQIYQIAALRWDQERMIHVNLLDVARFVWLKHFSDGGLKIIRTINSRLGALLDQFLSGMNRKLKPSLSVVVVVYNIARE